MYKELQVTSKNRNYSALFTNDVFLELQDINSEGAIYIIDLNIYELYKNKLDKFIQSSKYIIIEANEDNKSYKNCEKVFNQLIELQIRKTSKLIAIGGGIIQDISSFIASIIYRGLDWIFIPTTLLAQADSCIGGKTSINLGMIKNTIGNFYPPRNIFIDLSFLETLSIDAIKSGIGEIFHYYFYANSKFIDKLYSEYQVLLSKRLLFEEHILESLSIKKSVIEIDEFDKGERNKFNYGHTFGHALESISNYTINHGQAVTVGMDIANYISVQIEILDEKSYKEMNNFLKINFPLYDFSSVSIEEYLNFLGKDKKNVDEQLVCILSKGSGKLTKYKIPFDQNLRCILTNYFNNIKN